MLIDLLSNWEQFIEPSLKQAQATQPKSGQRIDDAFVQSSFEFAKPPRVIYVKNQQDLIPAMTYDELDEVPLTPEEGAVVAATRDKLAANNPKFYDGDQLIINGMLYDDARNLLYLSAVRVKYSFIRALSLRDFPEGSPIYQQRFFKTGVMVPFITRNESMFLIERARDGFYSSAAGFTEPLAEYNNALTTDKYDLVTYTAIQEAKDEFLVDATTGQLRVNASIPRLTSVSLRTMAAVGTIEFVAPCWVDCHSSYMISIIENNRAKDADEHTKRWVQVPLDSQWRDDAIKVLAAGPQTYPGAFLYCPMIASSAFHANRSLSSLVSQTMPHSRTRVYPCHLFKPKIGLPLVDPTIPAVKLQASDDSEIRDASRCIASSPADVPRLVRGTS